MKIVTVVGARPQFIKAATISRAIRELNDEAGTSIIDEIIVHTGQHYDDNMSKVFFDELDIPRPSFNLEIAGGGHGQMTGRMLEALEAVLVRENPHFLLVYGDTNSTLAGALAAVKLHIPLAHVEAGLRSFNFRMPEEVNRILTDRISDLLFCPTATAVANLAAEGISRGAILAGDVMFDASLHYRQIARRDSTILDRLQLLESNFALATCHRAENTDDPERLREILTALGRIAEVTPVILPMHPRTLALTRKWGIESVLGNVTVIEPLPFIDMMRLEQSAEVIITDSGGVQKEAFFFQVPCITIRDQTEWTETVTSGWNTLTGANMARIMDAFQNRRVARQICSENPYGEGRAAHRIVETLRLNS